MKNDSFELLTHGGFQSKMTRCSNFVLLAVPLLIQVAKTCPSDTANLDNLCDKIHKMNMSYIIGDIIKLENYKK